MKFHKYGPVEVTVEDGLTYARLSHSPVCYVLDASGVWFDVGSLAHPHDAPGQLTWWELQRASVPVPLFNEQIEPLLHAAVVLNRYASESGVSA